MVAHVRCCGRQPGDLVPFRSASAVDRDDRGNIAGRSAFGPLGGLEGRERRRCRDPTSDLRPPTSVFDLAMLLAEHGLAWLHWDTGFAVDPVSAPGHHVLMVGDEVAGARGRCGSCLRPGGRRGSRAWRTRRGGRLNCWGCCTIRPSGSRCWIVRNRTKPASCAPLAGFGTVRRGRSSRRWSKRSATSALAADPAYRVPRPVLCGLRFSTLCPVFKL